MAELIGLASHNDIDPARAVEIVDGTPTISLVDGTPTISLPARGAGRYFVIPRRRHGGR